MNVFPAIDIMNGKAVRLTKGDFSTQEIMCEDPVSVLESFVSQGATHLHVVDLDGARSGKPQNFETIQKLCALPGMFVEVGGGIRDREGILNCLNAGASRVILGTAAVRNFDFVVSAVREFGDAIAVGVDAKKERVAIEGWEEVSDIPAVGFCVKCRDAGVRTVIFTDISTDGEMKGTNLEAMQCLARVSGLDVIASGGISSIDELAKLKAMGISGAILGKAVYKGLIDLREAIRLAAEVDG